MMVEDNSDKHVAGIIVTSSLIYFYPLPTCKSLLAQSMIRSTSLVSTSQRYKILHKAILLHDKSESGTSLFNTQRKNTENRR